MNVRYQEQAEQDIDQAIDWYEKQQKGLGARFFEALICAELAVAAEPLLGREIEPTFRKWNLRHFPFALLYQVDHEGVSVRVIMDLRRKPGYWKHR